MSPAGKNVGCLILGEFVDDASQSGKVPKSVEERSKNECLKELVRRIAKEMAVPQFHLEEVVARVLSAVGPQIEERVRKELQELAGRAATKQ